MFLGQWDFFCCSTKSGHKTKKNSMLPYCQSGISFLQHMVWATRCASRMMLWHTLVLSLKPNLNFGQMILVTTTELNRGSKPEDLINRENRERSSDSPDLRPPALGVTVDTVARPSPRLLEDWLMQQLLIFACISTGWVACMYGASHPALVWEETSLSRPSPGGWTGGPVVAWVCGEMTVPGVDSGGMGGWWVGGGERSRTGQHDSICGPSVPSSADLWLSLCVTWQGYLSLGPRRVPSASDSVSTEVVGTMTS